MLCMTSRLGYPALRTGVLLRLLRMGCEYFWYLIGSLSRTMIRAGGCRPFSKRPKKNKFAATKHSAAMHCFDTHSVARCEAMLIRALILKEGPLFCIFIESLIISQFMKL
ncbi:hypothetical protein OESDEN_22094 [Oesophagostomum dentatum]|uniref:Uncharacterized protein n=1 Tax=Oesophagostomum dentatum TaxID=61180 RepID=A0A0B1S321_OESDE|nr:hypothetical protein OESDEN_22094 [Oesophagostomum dentatum]